MSAAASGQRFAKLSEVDAGDFLTADGGFDCLPEGAAHQVKADREGSLFIPCALGSHFLDGQLGDDGVTLVGLYRTTSLSPIEALRSIAALACCYGVATDEAELRDWLRRISDTAEAGLSGVNPEEASA